MTDVATDVVDPEVFETPTQDPTGGAAVTIEPPPAPAEQKPRKKRELTDAQREQIRANLAKGRATALANRRKKAILKRKETADRQRQLDRAVIDAMGDDAITTPPKPAPVAIATPKPRPPTPTPTPAPAPAPMHVPHVISTYAQPPW